MSWGIVAELLDRNGCLKYWLLTGIDAREEGHIPAARAAACWNEHQNILYMFAVFGQR